MNGVSATGSRTHLMDLIGMGTARLENRLASATIRLLFYSGLLSLQPRSAAALRAILLGLFRRAGRDRAVRGRLASAWTNRSRMPTSDGVLTASEQLGWGAIVGDEIWDQQSGCASSWGL